MTEPNTTDHRQRILLAQLDAAWEMLRARLSDRHPWDGGNDAGTTLTDAEYFWEPVPDCWSIRRRGEPSAGRVAGKGEWVMEWERESDGPAAVTTIAWRLCHIALWQRMRYDYTFGNHTLTYDDIEWPSNAVDAVAFVQASHQQWRSALDTLSPADLDQIGRSQMPHGLDPTVRFDDLLAWTNTEFTHHAAEVGLLRDLYRARFSSMPTG